MTGGMPASDFQRMTFGQLCCYFEEKALTFEEAEKIALANKAKEKGAS